MSDALNAVPEQSSCCDKTTCCGGVHAATDIKDVVREEYGAAAKRATSG
jgi:hypothetical protein